MTSIAWRRSAHRSGVALTTALVTCALASGSTGGAALAASTPDAQAAPAARVSLLGGSWGGKQAGAEALIGTKENQPDKDPGSLYTLSKAIGARKLWKHTDPAGRPLTGAGITVALLDSGVSAVAGLDAPGKLVRGPDLSEGTPGAGDVDEFGHGTFMAGLIAAKDSSSNKDGRGVPVDAAAPQVQQGLAPDAQLLSLKLASADGTTSVDAVIAGLAWTTAHRDDDGMHVRVVNLSFGAQALQPYQRDPLAAAVEAAWRAGIVVVASVGNDGAGAASVPDPALDPFVLAVGASDPLGKVTGWDKPLLADFSERTTSARHADLAAPGTSVVSLRAPGSTIDSDNPQGLVSGDPAKRLFRGSGTSQAAAVVSGAAALLLQARPDLTPDQVKAALVGTASPMRSAGPDAGAGQVNLEAALKAIEDMDKHDGLGLRSAMQTFEPSTGLDGTDLGELSGSWDGARWNGARWNGGDWS